jgi:DNA mismatch repair protein MutL
MKQINEICILPKEISEKIAAGEVVDRPLSIVKELVENSLDADAENIVIEIKNGGKTHIRVTDNGCGIPSPYAEMAFMRHATSKIKNGGDLEAIETLGFRGEALSSIAAVSKVEIITKARDEKLGTRILIEGGSLIEKSHVGCPDGTTIIVSDLFFNTPARFKFMKSEGGEASVIIDFISKLSLAYSNTGFRMINNGQVLFATRGEGNTYKDILTIYGKQAGEKLIGVNEGKGEYHLEAYISPPDITRPTKKGQVYFVNGRFIKDKVLENAVSNAYNELITQGRSPLIYIFLKVPNNTIDVNIHPNKREVRFEDNKIVSEFVTSALKKALLSREGLSALKIQRDTFKVDIKCNEDRTIDEDFKNADFGNGNNTDKSYCCENEKQLYQSQVDIKSLLVTEKENSKKYEASILEESLSKELKPLPFINLQALGSVFATYILATDEDHLYLIDQHAAHERVLYERLLKQFYEEEKDSQMLLSPVLLETTPAAIINGNLWIEELIKMGFIIETFGQRALLLKGIPSFMGYEGAKKFLDDFTLEIEGSNFLIDQEKMDKIITKSCKSAVKANDLLTMEEINQLIKDLFEADNPLSCPHGRPTLLKLSQRDLERLFKR